MSWCVYFLKSSQSKWYYVGSTNNIERRLREHNSGEVTSTKRYRPLQLVYSEAFETERLARKRERQLKGQRIAKENIIRHIEGQ